MIARYLTGFPLTLLAPGLVLCALTAVPAIAGDLRVSADTPAVSVSTRPVTRNFVRLPALEYRFRIDAACGNDARAETLSLSIADTRVSLARDTLAEGASREVSVTIPAGQIPPVTAEGFCVDGAGPDPADQIVLIPSILSMQASLLCVSDNDRRMTYASLPLHVELQCAHPDDAPPESN